MQSKVVCEFEVYTDQHSVSYFITSVGISWPKWRESKKLQHVEQV